MADKPTMKVATDIPADLHLAFKRKCLEKRTTIRVEIRKMIERFMK